MSGLNIIRQAGAPGMVLVGQEVLIGLNLAYYYVAQILKPRSFRLEMTFLIH